MQMTKTNSGAKAPHTSAVNKGHGVYSIKEACEILGISRTGLQYYRLGGEYKNKYKGKVRVYQIKPLLNYGEDWFYCPNKKRILITENGIKKISTPHLLFNKSSY